MKKIALSADLLFILGGRALKPMLAGAAMPLSTVPVIFKCPAPAFFYSPPYIFFLDISRFGSIYIYNFC